MKKLIAFGISFLFGLLASTSLTTSSPESEPLPLDQKSRLVSNELPAVPPIAQPAAIPSRGS